MQIKAHNEWKDATPWVNVDDVWFSCRAVYVKADDVWRKVYQRTAEIIPFPITRRYQGELQDVRVSAA
jgi:hypothetical protein